MSLIFPSPIAAVAGKPSASVINSDAKIAIHSNEPVTILSCSITLLEPGRLHISGVVTGTFYYVCGLAVYVDDSAVGVGKGTSVCHNDCMYVSYTTNTTKYMRQLPYDITTEELDAGTHEIKIGVLSKWKTTIKEIYINDRSGDDMASSSTLTVRAI